MTKGRGAREKAKPQIALFAPVPLAKVSHMLDPRVIVGGKRNVALGMPVIKVINEINLQQRLLFSLFYV